MALSIKATKIRTSKTFSQGLRTRGPADNPLYQFIIGFLSELSGTPEFFDLCSKKVEGWESVGTQEELNDNVDKELGTERSTLDKILGYLGKGIDLICGFKDNIIGFLSKKLRRYFRLFLHGRTRRRRFRWTVSGLWDDIKSVANDVGESIVKGTSKAGSSVIDGVKWVGKKSSEAVEYVKDKLDTLLKPLFDLFEKIKAKIMNFLTKHPLLLKLLLFARCFLENNGVKAIKTLVTALTALVSLVPKLATPAGWVEVIVNLICGWKDLKEGIDFLKKGLDEKDKNKRFNFYGKFTGKIAAALAG